MNQPMTTTTSTPNRSARKGVSIVKRRGQYWLKWRRNSQPGKYEYTWERLSEDVTTDQQAEAKAAERARSLAPLFEAHKTARLSGAGGVAFEVAIDRYVRHFGSVEGGPDGTAHLGYAVKRFRDAFAGCPCDAVTKGALAAWRLDLGTLGLSVSTVNTYLSLARAALNWMAAHEYVTLTERDTRQVLRRYPVTRPEVPTSTEGS